MRHFPARYSTRETKKSDCIRSTSAGTVARSFTRSHCASTRGREYFEKREIDDIPVEADEEDEGAEWGFLMPEPADKEFTFKGEDADYPESWLEVTPRGRKTSEGHLPQTQSAPP